jgi:hypothetical protein
MRVEMMRVRSDPGGRPAQLTMTAEERMESAAAMGELIADVREGARAFSRCRPLMIFQGYRCGYPYCLKA